MKPVAVSFSDHGGGSDRLSDESSKDGVSDSHPETLTDPEFSDPQLIASSPPQSDNEVKQKVNNNFFTLLQIDFDMIKGAINKRVL